VYRRVAWCKPDLRFGVNGSYGTVGWWNDGYELRDKK